MDGIDVLSDDDEAQPAHCAAADGVPTQPPEVKDVDILSDDEEDAGASSNVPVTTAQPTDVKDVDVLSDDEEEDDAPAGDDGQPPPKVLGTADAASAPVQAPADLGDSDNQPAAQPGGLRSVVTGHVDLADSSEDEGSAKKVPRGEPEGPLPRAVGDAPQDGGGPAETPDAKVTGGGARGRGVPGRQAGRGRGRGKSRGGAGAKAMHIEDTLEQEVRAGDRPTEATGPQGADAKDADILSDGEDASAPKGNNLEAPPSTAESDAPPAGPHRGRVDLADSSKEEGPAKKVLRTGEHEAPPLATASDVPHDKKGPTEATDTKATSGAGRCRGAAGRQAGRGRGRGRSRGGGKEATELNTEDGTSAKPLENDAAPPAPKKAGKAAAKAGPNTSPAAEGEEAIEQEAQVGEGPATKTQGADAKDVDMLSDDEDGTAQMGLETQAPAKNAKSADVACTPQEVEVKDGDILSDAEDATASTEQNLQPPPNTVESDALPTSPRKALRSVVIGHVDLADSSEDEASAKKVPRAGDPGAPPPAAVTDAPQDGTGPTEEADAKKASRASGAGRQAARAGGRGKSRGRGAAKSGPKASSAEQQEEAPEQTIEASAEAEEAEDGTSIKPFEKDVATPVPKRTGPPEQENSPSAAPVAKRPRQADVAKETKSDSKADSKAGDSKKEKLTKSQMENRVLEYMQKQNRPYNAQNVFDNLHGLVPKSQVQAILETLVGSNQIVGKEFGKAKVFLARQTATDDADGAEKEALQKDAEAAGAEIREAKAKVEALRRAAAERRSFRSLSAEAAESAAEAKGLEERAAEIRRKAEAAGEARDTDPQEVAGVEEAHRGAKAEWRRRKRLCMELLRSFKDAMGAALEDLVETYGVDTDEACGQLLEAQ